MSYEVYKTAMAVDISDKCAEMIQESFVETMTDAADGSKIYALDIIADSSMFDNMPEDVALFKEMLKDDVSFIEI